MTTTQRQWSINEIQSSARAAGSHWFDPSARRFFKCRILPDVYQGPGGIYFVSSEAYEENQRAYTVRQWLPPGDVETVGTFNSLTKAAAKRIADQLAGKPLEQQLQAAFFRLDMALTQTVNISPGPPRKYCDLHRAAEGGEVVYFNDGGYTRVVFHQYENGEHYYGRLVDYPPHRKLEREKAWSDNYELQREVSRVLETYRRGAFVEVGQVISERYHEITDAEQLRDDLARHAKPLTLSQVRRLMTLAGQYDRLCVDYCNGDARIYGDDDELLPGPAKLRRSIEDLAAKAGCGVLFGGDPRGCVVKLKMPDGATDDFAGDGWCVPLFERA